MSVGKIRLVRQTAGMSSRSIGRSVSVGREVTRASRSTSRSMCTSVSQFVDTSLGWCFTRHVGSSVDQSVG